MGSIDGKRHLLCRLCGMKSYFQLTTNENPNTLAVDRFRIQVYTREFSIYSGHRIRTRSRSIVEWLLSPVDAPPSGLGKTPKVSVPGRDNVPGLLT
jgi:hypothetical protein